VLNLSLGKVRFLDLKDPRQNGALDLGVRNQVFRNVNSEGDVFGVLLMIWLRSGGNPTNGTAVSVPAVLSLPKTNSPQGSQAPAVRATRK
jgi:hypothetical protein